MTNQSEAQAKAAATYNAAADSYDDLANSFWARFGKSTVERLGVRPGERVLDVCCGSGASALPAAERVGPGGSVTGVDLAENLLRLARAKAEARRLENIEFRVGDMLALPFPDRQLDAVACVFGIFFVPAMAAAARSVSRVLPPCGPPALPTSGTRVFGP